MNTVNYENRLVFCPPQLGKPDPREPRPQDGLDTRHRVVQSGSKSLTCWYAVLNMLRERYKAPNTENLRERQFERIASRRRKTVTAHECSLPNFTRRLDDEALINDLKALTKDAMSQPAILLQKMPLVDVSERPKLYQLVQQFLEQDTYPNLYEYLVFAKYGKRVEIDLSFFSQIHVNPEDLFDSMKQLDPQGYQDVCQRKGWKDLPSDLKHAFLDTLVKQVSVQAYKLKISSWHPTQPFESLLDQLERHGPLAVGGSFGRTYYVDPPKKVGERAGREVFGWPQNARKISDTIYSHMILLVGAEKTTTQKLVYYIDPLDVSDPLHPEKQRVYAMSYERLTSPDNISDCHGVFGNGASPAIGYAIRRH